MTTPVAPGKVSGAPDRFGVAILEAATDSPARFSARLVEALTDYLDLPAASLYTASGVDPHIRLKAQNGFDYLDYDEFQLEPQTYIGLALSEPSEAGNIHRIDTSSGLFRDQRILSGKRKKLAYIAVTTIPLQPRENWRVTADPRLAIALYGSSKKRLKAALEILEDFSTYISSLYILALEGQMMDLRRETVRRVAFASDTDDLADRAETLMQDRLGYARADIYLYNSTSDMLTPAGRVRRTNRGAGEPGLVDIPRKMAWGTAQALDSSAPVVQIGLDGPFVAEEFFEHDPPHVPENAIAVKIASEAESSARALREIRQSARVADAGRDKTEAAFGVLRVSGLRATFSADSKPVDPTWEDIVLIRFMAEMLAVLLAQLVRVELAEREFERRLHGASRILPSVAASLSQASRQIDLTLGNRVGSDRLIHVVDDANAVLEDLIFQLGTFDWADLEAADIDIRGDVINLLPNLIDRMVRSRRVSEEVTLNSLRDAGFDRPLFVRAHSQAMLTVFRNLVDNSIKYRVRGQSLDLRIERLKPLRIERSSGEVRIERIRFSDNGIGIPQDEIEYVMLDAFRGVKARHLAPAGLGRGLADCKRILEVVGGRVELRSEANGGHGTTFEIHMVASPRGKRT